MNLLLLATVALNPGVANLQAVPFTAVDLKDNFWRPRQEINRTVTIAHSLQMLEDTGDLKNFDLAAQHQRKGFNGFVFQDSDSYKVLEAASYTLATHPDPALSAKLDKVIARMAAAQREDGYLNTSYEIQNPEARFTNLRDNHEMYCAGHLIEAAVAHHRATGKTNLLNIATKYADLLCRTFGDGPGQREGYCGHPEIELALMKLWSDTGQERYFTLAKYFIDHRGSKFFATEHNEPKEKFDGTYWLDEVPIRKLDTMVGHAVRAGYLLSGATDVAAATSDSSLVSMLKRVWQNTEDKRTYVTGGIGSSASNEGFTEDYDLPNLTAYQESCASVAMSMWSHRMNLLTGQAKYADAMETSLYNGMLAGYALDGKAFFYGNPLESQGGYHRSKWFGCACCPPNESRTVAAIGDYAYALRGQDLYVNLFMQGTAKTRLADLDVRTEYPWNSRIEFTVTPRSKSPFALHLRVPGWSPGVNVTQLPAGIKVRQADGYQILEGAWKAGDKVVYQIAMPIRRVAADPRVKADQGQLALARGPLVYCLEQVDQSAKLGDIHIGADSPFETEYRKDLLGGVVVLKGLGRIGGDSGRSLYRNIQPGSPVPVVAVPYYAWDNRANGAMKVWMPIAPPITPYFGPESDARVSLSYRSGNAEPEGIHDGAPIKSSTEQPTQLCHFWPHKGGTEWVQYSWTKSRTIDSVSAYFFDDTGRGECRLPVSWQVEYLSLGQWKPVPAATFPVALDKWCSASFTPVKTTALRLKVVQQPNWASGFHEWTVHEVVGE